MENEIILLNPHIYDFKKILLQTQFFGKVYKEKTFLLRYTTYMQREKKIIYNFLLFIIISKLGTPNAHYQIDFWKYSNKHY